MFMELYREEKREEGDRGDEVGNQKEREIQLVISSLSVLHHPEHTGDSQSWVEKRRGREEKGNLVEKKESPKGERAVKPVISLPSENGAED